MMIADIAHVSSVNESHPDLGSRWSYPHSMGEEIEARGSDREGSLLLPFTQLLN